MRKNAWDGGTYSTLPEETVTLEKMKKTMQEFKRRYGTPDMFKAHPDCIDKFYTLLGELEEAAGIDITLTQAVPFIKPSKTLPEDRAIWANDEELLLFDFSKEPTEIVHIKLPAEFVHIKSPEVI